MNGKPRKPLTVNFAFTAEAKLRTPEGIVFAFLMDPDTKLQDRRGRVLEALSAFWLPLAAKAQCNAEYHVGDPQQFAVDAIYHLEIHVRSLRQRYLDGDAVSTDDFRSPRDRMVDFAFRSQPGRATRDGVLLAYLQTDDPTSIPHRQRVIQALTAFWLPTAAEHGKTVPEERIRAFARDSIEQIELHVQYLSRSFGLEMPPRHHERVYPVEERVEESPYASVPAKEVEEEDFDDEDAILSDWL